MSGYPGHTPVFHGRRAGVSDWRCRCGHELAGVNGRQAALSMADHRVGLSGERIGTVYLLHLDPGLPMDGRRIARHYIGWCLGEPTERLRQHLSGCGSPLIAAVVAVGGTAKLVRTFTGRDRHFERWLKRTRNAQHWCPVCARQPRMIRKRR